MNESDNNDNNNYTGLEIAVIGMALRFPGAANIHEFWENLKNGIETIGFFSEDELKEAGVEAHILQHPDYVKAMGYLEEIHTFDANFFEYTPIEVEVMDPQIRLFHEITWEALEDAAVVPDAYDGLIGLYAGASDSFYWKGLAVLTGKDERFGQFELDHLTNRDFLCSRTAYKFNLKGPVVYVQTACSTSLTAIHLASQGLISGEADIALAGGVTVNPFKAGYVYQEGMILSPDGHCRAFDRSARGTVGGNGAGIVVLKRLEDAIEDKNHIYAIIKGSAINNDGRQKIGYTAPSVEGQSEAVQDALQTARVEEESIDYIETHGTGTTLGDPVEIEALKLAFKTNKKGCCGLGSIKTNFGHMDNAAGAAGFIKTVLALKHQIIPPSLHFETPNPAIDFIDSPFYVNTGTAQWKRGKHPRRAGVSSLGIGGTNVHVILEEAPGISGSVGQWVSGSVTPPGQSRENRLIVLSAKTPTALDQITANLVTYLKKHPGVDLTGVAYTLQQGRKAFKCRRTAICASVEEAIALLSAPGPGKTYDFTVSDEPGNEPDQQETAPAPISPGKEQLEQIAQTWGRGKEIDWQALYPDREPGWLSLPTYPFERQQYRLEGDPHALGMELYAQKTSTAKKPGPDGWFYLPSWQRVEPVEPAKTKDNSTSTPLCWLLFIDNCGLGALLQEQLESEGELVVIVEPGQSYRKIDNRHFTLHPRREKDYETLVHQLVRQHHTMDRVVHLWGITPLNRQNQPPPPDTDRVNHTLDHGFYSLINIAKAIGKQGINNEIRLTAVTNHMQEVIGGDGIHPEKAVILGPVKVIPTEYTNIRSQAIDVEFPPANASRGKELVRRLKEELKTGTPGPIKAYRGGYQWRQTYEPRSFAAANQQETLLKQKGIYLVTGGLGGIGLALAQHLAESYQARLVLTGRTPFPGRDQWEEWLNDPGKDSGLKQKIQKIKELEQLGAEVLICLADTADRQQMQQAITQTRERFGPINGIIHCAGQADGEMIQPRNPGASERIFTAKITGTLVLDSLVKANHNALDFFLLCSSITAILPVMGQVGYCAANAFLDAYAQYQKIIDNDYVTISINWDRWQKTGIAVTAETHHKELTGEDLTGGITPEQGIETFSRIMAKKAPQVIVSTLDLTALPQQAFTFNPALFQQEKENKPAPQTLLRQRPALKTKYQAPTTPTQEKLEQIWEDFFGYRQLGTRDDFFELGGDSLKVLLLLPKIHRELGINISIPDFFNSPTIEKLSARIDGAETSIYQAIEPIEKKEYYPLSSAQKRLYLLQHMDPHSTTYNIPQAIPLEKDMETRQIETILEQLLSRHESLRTSFEMLEKEPVQRVHDEVEFKMENSEVKVKVEEKEAPFRHVLSAFDANSLQGCIHSFIRPFDLTQAPLLRSGIMELPGGSRVWVLDIHHIVSDAMSQAILTREFTTLDSGQELASLKLQYKDFTQWQNRLFASGELDHQEKYWLELYQDANELPHLNLHADHKRPEVFTFAGDHYEFELEKETTMKFKDLGTRSGATLFMNILAVMNILLYKYTGQTDIIIGSGTAGRPHTDLQSIMGMFVNTLAIRCSPAGDKTYNTFLQEVINQGITAIENQDVQFETLVDKLDLERDPSRNPLFDISLVLLEFAQNRETPKNPPEPSIINDNFYTTPYQNPASRFDMTFFVLQPQEKIYINIEYYTGIFKKETIQRLAAHFQNIIQAVINEPGQQIKNIEMLTRAEQHQVLYAFNDTRSDYPREKTLHELFVRQAEQNPDHIALIGPLTAKNRTYMTYMSYISYRELNRQTDGVAYMLQEKGVIPETIVAIMIERSIEMIVGILGILKAGGVYLPIDPGYPQERIDFMLKDSSARVILNKSEIRNPKSETSPNDTNSNDQNKRAGVMVLDFGHLNFEFVSNFEFRASDFNSSSLAYIIYTSGSTGTPKGVMVNHSPVINVLLTLQRAYGFKKSDTLLLKTTYIFDVSVTELFGWFLYGGRLAVLEPGAEKDPYRILKAIEKEKVTHINFVPAMFRAFIDLLEQQTQTKEKLNWLQYIFLAGEVLSPELVERFANLKTGVRLENLYGPTEGTVYSTRYSLQEWNKSSSVPIGKPLQNTKIYILDKDNHLQPVGVPGELFISGAAPARGYLNNPGLTSARFINTRQHQDYRSYRSYRPYIFYKTGDLGSWHSDGNIRFLGRIDQQVKIRGYRIEPGEIELQLLKHESIREAVVLDRKEENGDNYLCAYIVTGEFFDQEKIREYLSRSLPSYMIPAYFIPLENIPLTANGKPDRKMLPAPGIRTGPAGTAPGTRLEKQLAKIWAEVLDQIPATIGIDDNFFHQGGHSLKAFILTTRIHKEIGVQVPLLQVFKGQTIRGLSRYIQQAKKTAYAGINPIEKKEYYPLSSAQKRLYFIRQMEVNSISYNMPMELPLGKDIDKDKLETAVKQLIARHESLRTSFKDLEEQPVQVIHDEVEFAMEYKEVEVKDRDTEGTRGLAPLSIDPAAALISSFIQPFDITQAPLIRSKLIKLPDNHHIWLIDMHHIVSDGMSQTVLTEDFLALHNGQELTGLRLQYKDFSQWQDHFFKSGTIKAQEEYWLNLYADANEIPRIRLPQDAKRPGVFTFNGHTLTFALDREDAVEIKSLGAQAGATLYMNILAVLNVLFYKYTGQPDIIIGSPTAGRPHADLQGIIGMFVNTLPMRNHPEGEKTYEAFLTEVVTNTIDALANQDLQFEELVEKLDVERDTSRNPLFDVFLAVQNLPIAKAPGELALVDQNQPLPEKYLQNKNTIAKFDMAFIIEETEDNIRINIEYYKDIFKPGTVKRLAAHIKNIVKTVLKTPAIKLKDIEILTQEERRQVLDEFNKVAVNYPKNKTLHALFTHQAEKTPYQIALQEPHPASDHKQKYNRSHRSYTSYNTHLSYQELNQQSTRLSHYLQTKSGLTGNLVGLKLNRSIEMIVAILGILKAGCAYVPLNPNAPGSRNQYILDDCKINLVLTNSTLKEINRQEAPTDDHKPSARRAIKSFDQTFSKVWPPAGVREQLSYIIYTSGSTGKPKGVPITHANVSPLLHWGYRDLAIGPRDRTLQNLAYYFDWSVLEIFITLTTGASLTIVPEELLLDPMSVTRSMQTNGITVLHVTPTQHRYLVDVEQPLSSLRYLFIGAEKLTLDLVKRSFELVKHHCRVFNMYGPTETSIISAVLEIHRENHQEYQHLSSVPIGGPVGNTTLLVLDTYMHLCPVNIIGELYIAGDGLAQGYINNPDLTAEKFCLRRPGGRFLKKLPREASGTPRKNFSLTLPGSRYYRSDGSYTSYLSYLFPIYRTGDLARWLTDGSIEFIGRIDHQVKIRGNRIELGEIETQLLKHEIIKETVVLDRQDENHESYLCAYVVLTENAVHNHTPDILKQIENYLSGFLPNYMIPSYFIPIEKIPLTPNGKIDRKALPEPGKETGNRYIAPRDAAEEKLACIWAEVLGKDTYPGTRSSAIGIDDNFFRLGGHSLKAARITAKIYEEFHVKIPLLELFKTQTIRGINEYIKQSSPGTPDEIQPIEKKEYYDLSFNQKRVWILHQTDPGKNAFNMPEVMTIHQEIEETLISQALAGLIQRHESLRTGFKEIDNKAVQYTREITRIPFESIDLTDLEPTRQQTRVKTILAGFNQKPFQLEEPPLIRTLLIKVNNRQYIFAYNLHHIVTDGWSMGILTREFQQVYQTKEKEKGKENQTTVKPLKITYKDFAQWHHRQMEQGPQREKSRQYWKRFLTGELPVLRLPRDIQSYSKEKPGARYRLVIPADIKKALEELGQRSEITLFVLLYTIYNILLSLVSGQQVIVTAILSAGRDHPLLQEIVGFFINTVLYKAHIRQEAVFIELATKTRETVNESFKHQAYPLELVLDEAGRKYPEISTCFNMLNINNTEIIPLQNQETAHQQQDDTQNVKFDLQPFVTPYRDGIEINVLYNKNLFAPGTIEYMMKKYRQLIEFFARSPGKQLKEYKETQKRKSFKRN